MDVTNISGISFAELTNTSFAELTNISFIEYYATIKPLLFFVVGITIYALFIFKFYKFLARRDVISIGLDRYSAVYEGFIEKVSRGFFYTIENLLLVPLFVFFWFAILAFFLLVLAKSPSPNSVLLASVSLVAAIRVSAYYNENLSQDLAKMIPFAILAIFLIDASYFSIGESLAFAKQFLSLWKLMIYYLIFVIALEFVLRIIHGIATLFIPQEELLEK